MFGNFLQNFGLDFPLQSADAQGGLFGPNAPTPDATLGGPAAPGGAGMGLDVSPPASSAVKAPPGITGGAGAMTPPPGGNQPQPTSPASFGAPGQAPPSPLASPLAPGAGSGLNQPVVDPAPAAGIGSQFSGGQQGRF
jgi:hypothetical protein